jgi:hypothetical protein
MIGRISGRFLPPLPPTERPAFKRRDEQSYMDKLNDEFTKELWRELARTHVRTSFEPKPQLISATGPLTSPLPDPFNLAAGLFGIQAYVCNNCYAIKSRMMSFVPGDRGNVILSPSPCLGPSPDVLINLGMNAEQYITLRSKSLPSHLKNLINMWPGNQVSLVAAEVVQVPADQRSNNSRIAFVNQNKKTGNKRSISLPYSDAKCINLNSGCSWAFRATRIRQTPVTETELMEFLQMTKDSTFGFFKVPINNSVRIYLMALRKTAEANGNDDHLIQLLRIPTPENAEKPKPIESPPIQTSQKPAVNDVEELIKEKVVVIPPASFSASLVSKMQQ